MRFKSDDCVIDLAALAARDYWITFYVPPECKGQIVECSYADLDNEHVLIRWYDRSDGKTTYWLGRKTPEEALENDGDYWNRVPDISEKKEVDVVDGPIGPID